MRIHLQRFRYTDGGRQKVNGKSGYWANSNKVYESLNTAVKSANKQVRETRIPHRVIINDNNWMRFNYNDEGRLIVTQTITMLGGLIDVIEDLSSDNDYLKYKIIELENGTNATHNKVKSKKSETAYEKLFALE